MGRTLGITLSKTQIERLIEARKSLNMTQLELNQDSKISLRTIQDLERGRRDSFTESTLISICRSLNLTCDDILKTTDSSQTNDTQKAASNLKSMLFLSIPVSIILFSILFFLSTQFGLVGLISNNNNNSSRIDWITRPTHEIHPITPEWEEWDDKWKGKRSGMVFNYLHYPRIAYVGDSILGEFGCSFHYVGGTPEVYISLYGEWEPDNEIRLFHGVVGGDSTLILPVVFHCPDSQGLYKIRVFYATAFAPVPSFYGAPPPNQVTAPGSADYIELIIEILSSEDEY